MLRLQHFLLCILFLTALGACKDTFSGLEGKNDAISAPNEVVVICDDALWEGHVGDSVEYYFESPFPIMPQPEPVFDVRHFSTEDLRTAPLRKELRTYVILADLANETSETTQMVRADLGEEKLRRAGEDREYISSAGADKWAHGQLIIYVFGFGADNLALNVVKAYPAIAQRIHRHDYPLIDAATYLSREAPRISDRIREKFGFSLKVPGDFKIAVDKENFIWMRQDFDEAINNIAITRYPYRSTSQFDHDSIVQMRDRMGLYIEGSSTASFMVTNDEDLPVYHYNKELDGRYTMESRGIWELTDDFLGGPFVNYAIVNDSSIIMIDVFVHAPGKDKRNLVQRLEHIISSVKF